jgi:hypothetical protein
MPGNAGGAKGPDFWRASEDAEVEVIGDEPDNTVEDRNCPRLLCRGTKESRGTNESYSPCRPPRTVGLLPVCLSVKPIGEPDALIRHVRFDERGWETERCRMAQATAPILDSTDSDESITAEHVRLLGLKQSR